MKAEASPLCMQSCACIQRCDSKLLAIAVASSNLASARPPRTLLLPKALSAAQESVQDQLRKAQASINIVQLVADNRRLIDSELASTAVQKLAYLPRPENEFQAYENTLEELAQAARCDIPSLSSPVDLLAGFAELQFRCRAVDQLLEVFVVHYETSRQQIMPSTASKPVQQQWDTVSWGWADNSDMACKNLVTVAWAFGRLMQRCDASMLTFMDSIAAELSKKLHNNNLKTAFTPDDLADTVDGFANVLDTYHATIEPGTTAQGPR